MRIPSIVDFNVMKSIAMVIPIPPGKTDAVRRLARAIMKDRKKEFVAGEKRLKVTRECWFLQSSPQGDVLIEYAEGVDLEKAMAASMKAKDEFSFWYNKEVKAIFGVDAKDLGKGPLPELLLSYGI